jgi:hypothetical protein
MKLSTTLGLVLLCVTSPPIVATAGAQENQQSCMNDAITVCAQFIPDRERVASCLISNRGRISEACRMALTHYNQPMASPARLTTVR